jgi:hypothetical protein
MEQKEGDQNGERIDEGHGTGQKRGTEIRTQAGDWGAGNRGSVFGRIWETRKKSEVTMAEENSVIAGGENEEAVTQYLSICGEGNDCPSITDECNIRIETVKMKKERMENRTKQWREQAEEIGQGQNASILAGGDGETQLLRPALLAGKRETEKQLLRADGGSMESVNSGHSVKY